MPKNNNVNSKNNKVKNITTKKNATTKKVKEEVKVITPKEEIKKENSNTKFSFSRLYTYDKYIFEILLSFVFGLILFKVSMTRVASVIILLSNLYLVIKFRKNIPLFFCLIAIFYFNYSFIFSKYLFNTSTLSVVYNQIQFSDTKAIGIYCVYIFNIIIGLFLSGEVKNNGIDTTKLANTYSKKFNNIMGYFIIFLIALLLILAYWLDIEFLKALHEYSLILFIVGFLLCKENKIQSIMLVILMLISTGINLITGGRIISLLPCIAFFFIWLSPYFDYKKIIAVMVVGIVFFTIFGLYGDIKDSDQDYDVLTPKYVVDTIGERKFTLDTSISAYWTGLTFIEQRRFDIKSTTKNFTEYMTKYTIFGNQFGNYKHVYEKSSKNYIHYYGGYITAYFFYWLGYIGVVLISCYVGWLFKMLNDSKSNNSNLKIFLSIYVCSTIPRWYMYYPSPLIRGVILLLLFYLFVTITSKFKIFNSNN